MTHALALPNSVAQRKTGFDAFTDESPDRLLDALRELARDLPARIATNAASRGALVAADASSAVLLGPDVSFVEFARVVVGYGDPRGGTLDAALTTVITALAASPAVKSDAQVRLRATVLELLRSAVLRGDADRIDALVTQYCLWLATAFGRRPRR